MIIDIIDGFPIQLPVAMAQWPRVQHTTKSQRQSQLLWCCQHVCLPETAGNLARRTAGDEARNLRCVAF